VARLGSAEATQGQGRHGKVGPWAGMAAVGFRLGKAWQGTVKGLGAPRDHAVILAVDGAAALCERDCEHQQRWAMIRIISRSAACVVAALAASAACVMALAP
jgi:hypothetical protein